MRRLLSALVALFLCAPAHAETCFASWYGAESGRFTANGERFNPRGLTAASRSHKPGEILRVSYGRRSVIVRVNDYGPSARTGRCLDLSKGAAEALGLIRRGVAPVSIQRLR